MTTDLTHLDALRIRLSNERARLAKDNSEIRRVWVEQIERELAAEMKFLGIECINMTDDEYTDDELLAKLNA